VTDAVIRAALQNSMSDFEDAVASEAAVAAGLDLIVTRNLTDFAASSISALLPNDLLEMLSEYSNPI
jgi:sulfur transfer protein SufE